MSGIKLPNIAVMATGGTIAGTGPGNTDLTGYTAAVLPVTDLIAAVPGLEFVADVHGEQICQIASENMTEDIWLTLAARINHVLSDSALDAVVITHGTDTIEETAYFLHLTVHSAKPVVLVGAMRPATAISADGPINLYSAVLLAISPQASGRGVMVCLNDTVNGARDVAKTNTALADAFRSPELGYMGYIQGGRPHIYNASTKRHTYNSEFDVADLLKLPKVDIVYGYAGGGTVQIQALVEAGSQGIVYAGPGNGSLSAPVCEALAAARSRGILVVRSSRVGSGRIARNGEADDDALDFVTGDNLSPQKARILLMLAMTKTRDTAELQRIFDEY